MLNPEDLDYRPYQIYALIDPRDNLVHYVGMSINVHVRFDAHLRVNGINPQKRTWILELRRAGLLPLLKILETIDAGEDSHSVACSKEQYWIHEMAKQGHPLVNIYGIARSYRQGVPPIKRTTIPRKINGRVNTVKTVSVEWLSVDDIAKELSIHPDTVRGWIRDRKLKATKLGRDYRIKRVDLDKFIDERTISPDNN